MRFPYAFEGIFYYLFHIYSCHQRMFPFFVFLLLGIGLHSSFGLLFMTRFYMQVYMMEKMYVIFYVSDSLLYWHTTYCLTLPQSIGLTTISHIKFVKIPQWHQTEFSSINIYILYYIWACFIAFVYFFNKISPLYHKYMKAELNHRTLHWMWTWWRKFT